MSTTNRLITAEELWDMPNNGGHFELIDGQMREMMSPSNSEHVIVIGRLTRRLGDFVENNDLGHVFGAEGGFIISRNPDTVLAPDIAYVPHSMVPESGVPDKYWSGAPDLAVEVASPTDRMTALREKAERFLAAGARLVWLVFPKSRTIDVYEPNKPVRTLQSDELLDGGNVLLGFQCTVEKVFIPRKRP